MGARLGFVSSAFFFLLSLVDRVSVLVCAKRRPADAATLLCYKARARWAACKEQSHLTMAVRKILGRENFWANRGCEPCAAKEMPGFPS